MNVDVGKIRELFPILQQKVNGKPLVYLDNAATTQKPRQVIDVISSYYEKTNSNVHRAVHTLSSRATEQYEAARETVKKFINAKKVQEIVFVRGTTEAINLVSQTFGRQILKPGDEILITGLEHHSNIVPWQILCDEKQAQLKVVSIDDNGAISLDDYRNKISGKTRLVAVSHISNALGTINPIKEMIMMAHERGIPVLVDGAQAVPHMKVDVQALDCDFYAFSGHKVYGPTGIGVLYSKERLLEQMPPYQGGGDMIRSVTFEKTTYNVLPYKFEAGTPDIAGAIGLGEALKFVESLGVDNIREHENSLLRYATQQVSELPKVTLIGTANHKAAVVSFVVDGVHPHDIGTILDQEGVAIRTGHHCAQPIMDRFGIPATVRLSLAVYNTRAEIDALIKAMGKVYEVFG